MRLLGLVCFLGALAMMVAATGARSATTRTLGFVLSIGLSLAGFNFLWLFLTGYADAR